jgi:hypothetical protein
MAIVSYRNVTYHCSVAIKGDDYVHLMDSTGRLIAVFEGVHNFDAFSITDGDWEAPLDIGDCSVAIMRRDGIVVPGPHKCRDLAAVSAYSCVLYADFIKGWFTSPGGFILSLPVDGLSRDDLVMILSTTDDAWAQSSLNITTADGYLVIFATSLPSADVTMRFSVTKLKDTVALN